METLSTIKIKYKDGTYSKQIPISILSKYVKWNKKNTLVDVLGEIDINTKGSVQDQLDTLFTEKIDIEQLRYYVANLIADEVTDWLDTNINPISGDLVIIDPSLNISGAAADAKATGDAIQSSNAEIQELQNSLNNLGVSLTSKIDDAYVEDGFLYMVSDGEIVVGPLGPFSGGGGGGGGGSETSAVLTVTNTSGWLSKTISAGSPCQISFNWTSIEDDLATGNGNLRILVNNVFKTSREISQGNVTVDVSEYLSNGSNTVKVQVSDIYGQMRSINYSVTVVALTISSSFVTTAPFTGLIQFNYTPVGAVTKTVHFILDGTALPTQSTTVSGRQVSYSIPAQSHGSHSLRVYFDAEVNGELVRSNELYYEFICLEEGNENIIIISSFDKTSENQYATIPIPFTIYDPTALTAEARIYINNTLVSTQTVDRTEQVYSYRANNAGTLTIRIEGGTGSRTKSKTITLNIIESQIDVEAETENLVLHLTSQGRSNQEEHPETWSYNNISATLTDFNFSSDGWQKDADGVTVLRVSGDARVTVPYKPFAQDFRTTGKTIEFQFATKNVLDYDSVVLSCMSGNRGFSVTAQKAYLKSEQSEIGTQYKEDEHVRIAFVCEKRTEHRMLLIYINGIVSGAVQYPADDDFSQQTPVNISIGSNDCTIDIYNIRIYDNDLTRFQVVNNWIADTQDGGLMLNRYVRNNVFDEYGNIVISNLPSELPYMIISCPELPQSKGDKKTCSGSFVNPMSPSKSFTFEDCQIDVQGTSSQYYPRKNYKMKFNGGFRMQNGTQESKYAMSANSIPVKTFCMKADFASSEGANNVELVNLYNAACPYKTPAQVENSKVRQGIEGFPMIIFWNNTSAGETTFLGKYNFNNDKSTEDVFGLSGDDESWETLNNAPGRALWQSADFSGTAWQSDFEARYPDTDPPYVDTEQLASFAEWAVSTDTTQATNANLPASVTYDGVTYTKDTAEYRLAKFRAEAGEYMELQSTLFYYLFTELFLMVDSRAKNAFPSFMGTEVTI